MDATEKHPSIIESGDNALKVVTPCQRCESRCQGRLLRFLVRVMITGLLITLAAHWNLLNFFHPKADTGEILSLVDTDYPPTSTSAASLTDAELPQHCRNTPKRLPRISEALTLDTGRNLTIVQGIDLQDPLDKDARHLGVSGAVIFRQTDDDHQADQLDIDIIVNDESIEFTTEWDADAQHLRFITPRAVTGWADRLPPCIRVTITAWIAPESALLNLVTDAVHLDIKIFEGLDFQLQEKSTLKSVSGSITAPERKNHDDINEELAYNWTSRDIELRTTSGDIKGWYPLYDLLKVRTASGDITVDVKQEDILASNPKPAVLDVSTVSGTTHILESLNANVPARDYAVSLETVSGSISGQFTMSSKASFTSQSGDLHLKVLPILQRDRSGASAPKLKTSSRSSSTKLDLLEPLWIGDSVASADASEAVPLSEFDSRHTSISGNIDLHYPASWTGEVQAETISGSQTLKGDGLQTHKKGFIPKVVIGRKGDGVSSVFVKTVSGRETFVVGQDGQEL